MGIFSIITRFLPRGIQLLIKSQIILNALLVSLTVIEPLNYVIKLSSASLSTKYLESNV
jgi:hypothetical protein